MALLELHNIGKSYGAVQALSNVSFAIAPGEIVGLMGDNGAGKSTLVKIVAGVFPPSEGTMRFAGSDVRFQAPVNARSAGIEVVHQDLALADNLSAAANIFLAANCTARSARSGFSTMRRWSAAPWSCSGS